jgi:hypothetical protein
VTGCNLPSYRSSVWRIGVKNSCCGGCASADEGQTLPQFGRKNNTDPDDVNSDSIIREKRYFGSILYLSKKKFWSQKTFWNLTIMWDNGFWYSIHVLITSRNLAHWVILSPVWKHKIVVNCYKKNKINTIISISQPMLKPLVSNQQRMLLNHFNHFQPNKLGV